MGTSHSKQDDNQELYVVGFNNNYQFGLNHPRNVTKLTKIKTTNRILSVNCTLNTTLITDYNRAVWVCGSNSLGQCGIDIDKEFVKKRQMVRINFEEHHVNILKICSSVSSNCTFYISDGHRVYANGPNKYYQLGLKGNGYRKKPKLINSLINVIDVQCGYWHNIALCDQSNSTNTALVIQFWLRNINKTTDINIPIDIIKLILSFNSVRTGVYEAGKGFGGNNLWTKMDIFNNKQIIKIRSGVHFSLFLEESGVLWSCARYSASNQFGHLGLGHSRYADLRNINKELFQPQKIPYFITNDIQIKDMQCGHDHSLAIDSNGSVYSWGKNIYGGCGHAITKDPHNGITGNILSPKLISSLKHHHAIKIKCGAEHSYVLGADKSHCLFGRNNHNQCTMLKDKAVSITSPHCINKTIEKVTKGKIIKDVYLGKDITIIVTE
eukprot:409309_1